MLTQISSPQLIPAKCSHFGLCGGCLFQNVSYEDQLKEKETFIRTVFSDFDALIEPILPCDPPWEYRNKMEFSFSQSREGQRYLGLMLKKGRGRVVSLNECHLTSPWFIDVLRATYEWWSQTELEAYFPPKDKGSLRTLIVREGKRTGEHLVMLTVSGHPDYALEPSHIEAFKNAVLASSPISSLILRQQFIAKKTPTRFEETVLYGKNHIQEILYDAQGIPLTFTVQAGAFFQPCPLQAEKIYQKAIDLAALTPEDTVLDLYCGIGGLGIFAAKHCKKVLGIEICKEAVEAALTNIRVNQIQSMDVLLGDCSETIQEYGAFSVVIVDPPRAGLGLKAIKKILMIAPKKIIYVSCNPLTQKIDLDTLISEGYQIRAIVPVDQFPHTPHVENIIALERLF